MIETSATSTDPADCKKLETQQFMEQTIAGKWRGRGRSVRKKTRRTTEGAKSVSVSEVEVDGSSATAEAALTGGSLDGQTVEVGLVKTGERWKLNEVVKFTKLDQGKLVEGLEDRLSKPSSEVDPKFAALRDRSLQAGLPSAKSKNCSSAARRERSKNCSQACASSPSA